MESSDPTTNAPDFLDLDHLNSPLLQNKETHEFSCLVGKLLSDKPTNSFALIDVMKKAWKAKKGMEAREWTNKLFLFSFEDDAEMKWVIRNQPWHFEGSLFLLRPLGSQEQPSQIRLSEAHLWTRIYDAPVSCMNMPIARALAGKLGSFICADSPQELFGKFIRIKVAVDITKPLSKGISIRVGGKHLWLAVKYEALPTYCFNCGLLGHSLKYCESFDSTSEFDPLNLPFGPNIKASPLKKNRPWQNRGPSSYTPPLGSLSKNLVHSPSTASTHSNSPPPKINRELTFPSPNKKIMSPNHNQTLSTVVAALNQTNLIHTAPSPSPVDDDPMSLTPSLLIAQSPNRIPAPTKPPSSCPPSLAKSPSHHSSIPPPNPPQKREWKRLARKQHTKSSNTPSKKSIVKRPLPCDINYSPSDCPQTKRIKMLSTSKINEPAAETALVQSRRSQ